MNDERSNSSPDPWPADPEEQVDDLEVEDGEGAKVTGGEKNANNGEGWSALGLDQI